MRRAVFILLFLGVSVFTSPLYAAFAIDSAIVEFTQEGPRQQDIQIISRSTDSDYIVSEVSEIQDPGAADEKRVVIEDPEQSMLLVTPDKTILTAGARKIARFVLLREPDAQEHVYRVALKPVIKGVGAESRVGLKILIGYEVLVIVRPAKIDPHYTATRQGKHLTITNSGNSDVLFQNGQQCPPGVSPVNADEKTCPRAPVLRVYAGQKIEADLPMDAPVTYSFWDGITSVQKQID